MLDNLQSGSEKHRNWGSIRRYSPAYFLPKMRISTYLETPGILQAQISSVPPEMRGRIDHYNRNMQWASRRDAEKPGDSVLFKVDVAESGWYYFGITDLSGGSYAQEYTFVVTK
ncbi:MAG: hypothetical protein NQU42_07610 [Methanothrix sp.]|uniref:hypothetical protein n=1 Tax=Methanothrix sp. TaxID=90426 RepID=UPI0025DC5B6D|nr:hypothetical protein [Methanothrix sp.]MCQ8903940.1 hypothetical protein [Methanothrix sp.]